MAVGSEYPFRVFISYSHADIEIVRKMAALLEEMGLHPLWDRDIHPGTPFTDTIKELIARSHIFIPLITENSHHRPWVHQETGFATALNLPIVPIAIDKNLPSEMICQTAFVRLTWGSLCCPNLKSRTGLSRSLNGPKYEPNFSFVMRNG
ncbi:MAG: TIR domain-containing protein [Anaerolineae bacterium]|nr:TIR domain-containing protein [Anaerolineae bacterium]